MNYEGPLAYILCLNRVQSLYCAIYRWQNLIGLGPDIVDTIFYRAHADFGENGVHYTLRETLSCRHLSQGSIEVLYCLNNRIANGRVAWAYLYINDPVDLTRPPTE